MFFPHSFLLNAIRNMTVGKLYDGCLFQGVLLGCQKLSPLRSAVRSILKVKDNTSSSQQGRATPFTSADTVKHYHFYLINGRRLAEACWSRCKCSSPIERKSKVKIYNIIGYRTYRKAPSTETLASRPTTLTGGQAGQASSTTADPLWRRGALSSASPLAPASR